MNIDTYMSRSKQPVQIRICNWLFFRYNAHCISISCTSTAPELSTAYIRYMRLMQISVPIVKVTLIYAPPALRSTVVRTSDEAAGTVGVLCTVTDAETVEWSVTSPPLDFHADPDTVTNSAASPVVLHQGLTLSSVIETGSTDPKLRNIESRLVFDSSFPLMGTFFAPALPGLCPAQRQAGLLSLSVVEQTPPVSLQGNRVLAFTETRYIVVHILLGPTTASDQTTTIPSETEPTSKIFINTAGRFSSLPFV